MDPEKHEARLQHRYLDTSPPDLVHEDRGGRPHLNAAVLRSGDIPVLGRVMVVDDNLDARPSDHVAKLPHPIGISRVDHDDRVDRCKVQAAKIHEVEEPLVQVVEGANVRVLAAEKHGTRALEELRGRNRRGVGVEVRVRMSDDDTHGCRPLQLVEQRRWLDSCVAELQ